jgi:hypothetical protein
MGIDASELARFSPWAQKQIAQKIAAQSRAKAENQVAKQSAKQNKYHNIPDSRQGAEREIKFKSRKEAQRYDELMLMLKAGQIHELKLQPQFTLQEAYTTPEGVRVRAIRYVADFSYNTGNGLVVEDVKGGKATQTRVYKLKKKLMQDRFGITVQEIET